MPNTPFLKQVAQYYSKRQGLQDYCFIFPNRRSIKFFNRYLDECLTTVAMMPETLTISDFVQAVAQETTINQVDALFLLHKCYCKLADDDDKSFDKFVYWASVVLSDFNDVDMGLVDAKALFRNIRDYREIQSNFIDDDLLQRISDYFNVSFDAATGDDEDTETLWKNYKGDDDDNPVKQKFLKLWNVLYDLYVNYNKELSDRNLSYSGRLYRKAAGLLSQGAKLEWEKCVFVGFNMLSTSELAIFNSLKKRGVGEFLWDDASPAFKHEANRGGRQINFYSKEFPSPRDFMLESIDDFPRISTVGVPTAVAQTKQAYAIISKMLNDGVISRQNAIDTALVLPDDILLLPLLNTLPKDIAEVNITMGYPLRNSDIMALMRTVAKTHRQARRNADEKWEFYRNDVRDVLSHPIIKKAFPQDALTISHTIDRDNLFNVPASMFENTGLEPLFHTIDNVADANEVSRYLLRLKDFALGLETPANADKAGGVKDAVVEKNKRVPTASLQEAFIKCFAEVAEQLAEAIETNGLPLCDNTIFFLLDRVASAFTISFDGEPLGGMQIMGMLETRLLDFKNLVILNANERVLPHNVKKTSFVSDMMRRHYGMATSQQIEASSTYSFYRLVSRADNVTLIYDTSAQSMGSSEPTRFISQLEMIYGCAIDRHIVGVDIDAPQELEIKVEKDDRIAAKVNEYLTEGSERKLSASSINEFINCGLKFYLHHIEGLGEEDDVKDFMGAATFGTVVHDTMQMLYYPDLQDGSKQKGPYKVTGRMIKDFGKGTKDSPSKVDKAIEKSIRKNYFHDKNNGEPLTGEALILSEAIRIYVNRVLKNDLKLLGDSDDAFFDVLECEKEHNVTLDFGGKKFNFRYIADRVDRINGQDVIRMADYKTGKDETSFKDIDELFITGDKRRHAILQLMLYCNAYSAEYGPCKIMPYIYKIQDMEKSGVYFGKDQLADYNEINEDFKVEMAKVADNIFDRDKPFVQTPNKDPQNKICGYCNFADFCHRTVMKKNY